ncbi:MAG TPA: TatD family hydrolase [Verrucomicrobiae bacterium]|nr:TatD family hydrolase [Verrucomicrobiae bacterium]
MPEFFDTHAHLDFPDFADDVPQVIERAAAAGITRIITIGTDADSSRRAIALAGRFPSVYAAVGWHPTHVSSAPEDIRPILRKLAAHRKVVAIGETGLDYHHLPAPEEVERYKSRQAEIFQQQLELATELRLNCIIHQRDSFEPTLRQMEPWKGKVRGVFHCFGGDVTAMQQVLAIGSLVSFTGIVTFKNAQTVRETVAAAPLDKFMLETDCPFLAPVPYRGKRCEPAYVRHIAESIADTKKCSLEDLGRVTSATAYEFFPRLK